MNELTKVEPHPTVKVARDLTEIVAMCDQLDDQAEHKANATIDGTSLPGGSAMVALAHVANIEAWGNLEEAADAHDRLSARLAEVTAERDHFKARLHVRYGELDAMRARAEVAETAHARAVEHGVTVGEAWERAIEGRAAAEARLGEGVVEVDEP